MKSIELSSEVTSHLDELERQVCCAAERATRIFDPGDVKKLRGRAKKLLRVSHALHDYVVRIKVS